MLQKVTKTVLYQRIWRVRNKNATSLIQKIKQANIYIYSTLFLLHTISSSSTASTEWEEEEEARGSNQIYHCLTPRAYFSRTWLNHKLIAWIICHVWRHAKWDYRGWVCKSRTVLNIAHVCDYTWLQLQRGIVCLLTQKPTVTSANGSHCCKAAK